MIEIKIDDREVIVVVREEKDGTILWNFMHADDRRMNNHRVGTLLKKK